MKKKILIIAGIIIGLYLVFDVTYYVLHIRSSNSYEECANTPGSTTLEKSPPTCVYEDGTRVDEMLGLPGPSTVLFGE